MTVELKHMATGKITREKFVTNIQIDGKHIRFEYDKIMRPTMVYKKVPMDTCTIVGIYE